MREMYLSDASCFHLRAQIVCELPNEIEVALVDIGREPFSELVDALLKAAAATCILIGGPDVTRVMLVLGVIGRIWPASLYRDLD
ncbi:hypothetical protein GCM10008171_14250 [Methylopila jiangsuensis]|uniref:Uncharacterized protein n=1 Tax=Methylopila jiangsuensis TaxID=586230 RepID=A0A9W6JEL5_9HYPH|nr:hypothetical protein [Methylopila jiangsuensis]MDR6284311.1 hypothetical protein [Methylopila jiangsuensis]GLK76171.1 hypothetical protein GCM10008171_14250 [Methylopila jiangsuensis]